jgi:hypothetical protein
MLLQDFIRPLLLRKGGEILYCHFFGFQKLIEARKNLLQSGGVDSGEERIGSRGGCAHFVLPPPDSSERFLKTKMLLQDFIRPLLLRKGGEILYCHFFGFQKLIEARKNLLQSGGVDSGEERIGSRGGCAQFNQPPRPRLTDFKLTVKFCIASATPPFLRSSGRRGN